MILDIGVILFDISMPELQSQCLGFESLMQLDMLFPTACSFAPCKGRRRHQRFSCCALSWDEVSNFSLDQNQVKVPKSS